MKRKETKVYVNRAPRGRYWRLMWKDPETGKMVNNATETEEREEAELLARSIELEINGHRLDTKEDKIRKFIEIYEREATPNENGNITKKEEGRAGRIACKEVGITKKIAYQGRTVVLEADALIDHGERLLDKLNTSVKDAYHEVMEMRSGKSRDIDSNINKFIHSLLVFFDDRADAFGGDEHRNKCISLMKQIYAEIDEWRASE